MNDFCWGEIKLRILRILKKWGKMCHNFATKKIWRKVAHFHAKIATFKPFLEHFLKLAKIAAFGPLKSQH